MVMRSVPAQVRLARRCAVKNGDAVTVHYVERSALNDTVVRDSRARKEAAQDDAEREEVPLTFIVGKNTVIKGIEKAVIGMEVGDVKEDVLVPAIDAYGEHRADLTATIPKESCPEGMKVGITVNLSNGLQVCLFRGSSHLLVHESTMTRSFSICRRLLPTRIRQGSRSTPTTLLLVWK